MINKYECNISKKILFLLCTMILLFTYPVQASHDGTGGGGGPSVPLYLTSSTPANGETEVSTNVTITLYNSHNVADVSVRSNNTAAISMATDTGVPVKINVSYPNDFARRQQVFITPIGLQAQTTYIITMKSSFMSANTYTTGKIQTVTFTTGKDTQTQETPTPTPTIIGEDTQTQEASTKTTTEVLKVESNSSVNNTKQNKTMSNDTVNNPDVPQDATVDIEDHATESLETDSIEDIKDLENTAQVASVSDLKPGKVTKKISEARVTNSKESKYQVIIVIVVFIIVVLICFGVYKIIKKRQI